MSKPRLHLEIAFDTEAHAATVQASLLTQLTGKDIFDTITFITSRDELDRPTLLGKWRFNNVVDRDAVKDWVMDQVENSPVVKTWIRGVRLSWHRCTHDDLVLQDCTSNEYGAYTS